MKGIFKLLFTVAVVSITLYGCKKNRLKKPAFLTFQVDMNRSAAASGNLVFSSGHLTLADFSISGTREEGDPISFSKSFGSGLIVPFGSSTISQLDYDIPQGIYTSLEIEFNSVSGSNSLIVEGSYTNSSSQTYPMRFEFWSSESFEVEGEAESGASTILIEKNTNPVSRIELDPEYWFQPISIGSLDGATLTNISGTPTLLITEDVNESIFDLIADRIDQSLEANFSL